MNRLESLWQAIGALRGNKLRSLLTMLGVIIGVGAMIIMVAVVTGFQRTVQREFEGLGSRLIFTFYQPDERRARETFRARRTVDGLRTADVAAIREQCDLLANISAERDMGNVRAAHGAEEHGTRAVGVEPQYQQVRSVRVARGRFVEAADLEQWRPVCVLGTEIAQKLFADADPVGRDVRVNRTRLTVVGLLEHKPRSFDENYNDRVYIPLTTVLKRMAGDNFLSVIFSQARAVGDTEAAMDQIWGVLMRRHDDRADFRVDSQARVVQTLNTILFALGGVLARGLPGLSLLVGGIGIMDIMLVSVTERTREIGIRKAVGAKRNDILWQFLIEAGTLSGVGGLLGLALGYGGAAIVAAVGGERLPASVPPWAAAVGLGFAVAVGVIAGVYPAFSAARLDPIQALRHE